ncbi:MAG TPA: aldo/keto reductase [Vicinamibacterales bacterium]|jgi:aryl-alcohol dehydrogenase-like predicted oxidoreductase|nr:aldo/keto reductase [Vicinamibacterales bacterium]
MTAAPPRVRIAPDYEISCLLKGGWQLATGHSETVSTDPAGDMDRFVAAGITTFDCADIYTGVEATIGDWLARRRARGDAPAVQVHTKYVPDLDRLPSHSRADVVRGVDRSLTRLQVERIDLVQLHWWDFDVPGYVEAAAWLDELRRAGKIRNVGLTNFDRPRLTEILAAGVPIATHQVQYSVLDRRPAGGMATFCADRGIHLLCYGAVAGGFLGERYLRRAEPALPLENRSLVKYRLIVEEFGGWDRFQVLLAALEGVAVRHRAGISAVAIRWVLDQPGVAGVIVGARHAGHLDQLQRACAITLDDDDRAAIARVQAGAPGPAGDVYDLERVKGGRHAGVMRYTLNRGAHS